MNNPSSATTHEHIVCDRCGFYFGQAFPMPSQCDKCGSAAFWGFPSRQKAWEYSCQVNGLTKDAQ